MVVDALRQRVDEIAERPAQDVLRQRRVTLVGQRDGVLPLVRAVLVAVDTVRASTEVLCP
jgi:hypothetical protein